jgi:hypothetical protein
MPKGVALEKEYKEQKTLRRLTAKRCRALNIIGEYLINNLGR